jgi:hypothetical protein
VNQKVDHPERSRLLTQIEDLTAKVEKLQTELETAHTVLIVDNKIVDKPAGIEVEVHDTQTESTMLYPKGMLIKDGTRYYADGSLVTKG